MNREPRVHHVFVIIRPGHDLDGEEWSHRGTEAEALETASNYVESYRRLGMTFDLRKIGVRSGDKFTPCVPTNELPWWRREEVA